VQAGDFVNIIQHPDGGPKQITLYHNVITAVRDMLVQFLTDTDVRFVRSAGLRQ
jgi:hypothetical protein